MLLIFKTLRNEVFYFYIHKSCSIIDYMTILLLIIIYLIFISVGLPDGVLGSAWPAIHTSLHIPVEIGGFIAALGTIMTILSSLMTAWLIRKLGTGPLLAISTALTAGALTGYSQTSSIEWLFLLAVPLGLGGGAIDSTINNYVASHYEAHHMNWLHAFWGIGATAGPAIIALSLVTTGDWHKGYLYLSAIQIGIVSIILLSLPLWNKVRQRKHINEEEVVDVSNIKYRILLKDSAVLYSFFAFLLYVGVEVGMSIWVASYLVAIQLIPIETASLWAGIYYGAITVGRIIAGFTSFKVSSKQTVRAGIILALLGIILLVLNTGPTFSLIGIVLIGLGLAPIYPSLVHMTPERFGIHKSAKVMSLQMVGGYIGASAIPPLIGVLASELTLNVIALIIPLCLVALLASTEVLNLPKRKRAN